MRHRSPSFIRRAPRPLRALALLLLASVLGGGAAIGASSIASAQLPGLLPTSSAQGMATGPISAPAPTTLGNLPGPVFAPPPAPPPAPYRATPPSRRVLYRDGQSGRFLLDGPWLFRRSGANLPASTSTAGWTQVFVPYAWNALDYSNQSYAGGVGWYRRDFTLPSAERGLTWIVRFESVDYRATVYLNGHRIGDHTGEFLPFEFALPAHDLKRSGANRLVIRVDSHHSDDSLPPYQISTSGTPAGGWWNYSGILREVYLREVRGVDIASALVNPDLACAHCAARVDYRVEVHNYSSSTRSVSLTSHFGAETVHLGTADVGPGSSAVVHHSITIAHPILWSPASPHLYSVTIDASGGAHYSLQSGIRSIRVIAGHLFLNGLPLHLRGVGVQEDSASNGFAQTNADRDALIAEVKDLGADLIRSQYPLHPYLEELADQQGILLWSEIPVFSVREDVLSTASFRRSATNMLAQNIVDNGSHPSIAIWSIANELSSRPGSGQITYIRQAVSTAHALDPSRPVGIAIAGYPNVTCQRSAYRPLQVLGFNDYFGWYPGPNGQIADRELLGPYVDQIRRCYPRQAVMITEFGAEANRDGPVDERGTYAFQADFAAFHLGVFATRPFLSAAVYWALDDFRVRPGWNGGNPLPDPPFFDKGLVTLTGAEKPAFGAVRGIYHAAQQVG
jgi:beta-glucuronidase